MTGRSCRRLLARSSLIFTSISISWIFVASILVASILVAPTFLRGQGVADRSPGSDSAVSHALAPNLAPPNLASPNLTPASLAPLRDSSPTAPVWIPPPSLPQTYPVRRYPAVIPAASFSINGSRPLGSSSPVVSPPSDAPLRPSGKRWIPPPSPFRLNMPCGAPLRVRA